MVNQLRIAEVARTSWWICVTRRSELSLLSQSYWQPALSIDRHDEYTDVKSVAQLQWPRWDVPSRVYR